MEWLTIIKDAIEYMEQNLLTVTGPEEVAKHVHISTIYLQRGFQVLTGYTLGEYIRNRRLFKAYADRRKGHRHRARIRLRNAGKLHKGIHTLSRHDADRGAPRPLQNAAFSPASCQHQDSGRQ